MMDFRLVILNKKNSQSESIQQTVKNIKLEKEKYQGQKLRSCLHLYKEKTIKYRKDKTIIKKKEPD